VAIWYVLWLLGIFFQFGMWYQEKSGNPDPQMHCNKRMTPNKKGYEWQDA
jgi:hypothetical protein